MSKPYVVSARHGDTRRFKTLGDAKAWPRKLLEKQKDFAIKFGSEGLEPIMNLQADIDALLDIDLDGGGVALEATIDPHTGARVAWFFRKEAT